MSRGLPSHGRPLLRDWCSVCLANGNALLFDKTGEVEFAKKFLTDMAFFWIKDESVPNTTVRMWLYNHEGRECIDEEGPQIKTPLRLVKSK